MSTSLQSCTHTLLMKPLLFQPVSARLTWLWDHGIIYLLSTWLSWILLLAKATVLSLASRRGNWCQHHYQHDWHHKDGSSPFSQTNPAQHHPQCWGTTSRHCWAHVFLPGQGRGMEGAHPAHFPCFYLTESFPLQSGHSPAVLFALELHFQFRASPFYRNALQQPLCSVCFILTGHPSKAGLLLFPLQSLFCSNVQHLTVAKISRAKQPGHLDVGLPILTVCSVCFMSCVWFGLCRALYITPK